jgi:hypothetical protein
MYESNEQLEPQFRLSRGGLTLNGNNESDYFLAVDDMDADGSLDIISAANYIDDEPGGMQYLQISVMSIDSSLSNSTIKANRYYEQPVSNNWIDRHFAIALGDFNGDRTWLGSPVHYRRTEVIQPSVILNTPPIHYDILNSAVYDISGCYPDQSCDFLSTYTQTSTTDRTVTIETHEDWGVSASLELIASVVKEKATAIYGEKFSNKSTDSETITISTGRIASGDDWIFTNIYDIDFYEYPVYDGEDPAPLGYFIVSNPGTPRSLWIEAKDDLLLGNQFRPDHEVGNILSYRQSTTFDLSGHIYDFPEQTVGGTGNSFVSLQLSTFSENAAETSWDSGLEINATIGETFDVYGIELGFEIETGAHYNFGEITTQTISVDNSLEMRGDLGHTQPQFGTSGTYQVLPYAYWTSYGALALDYKVNIPDGDNFWQNNYGGKSDIAFSLPWRYDQEKGIPFPANDASYRSRTRDIILLDSDPRYGDTVRVIARIRNMGLESVSTPVQVQFYLGDPAADGALIGETQLDTILSSRTSQNVFIDWIIPAGASYTDERIYVLLDPDNLITNEVHEDNNSGWAPVIASGTPTSLTTHSRQLRQFVLDQAYPNPFNPQTTIGYSLGTKSNVSVKIYDIIGREIATITDGIKDAGKYEVMFNAEGLASGLYFYKLTAITANGKGHIFRQTRKMMYIK